MENPQTRMKTGTPLLCFVDDMQGWLPVMTLLKHSAAPSHGLFYAIKDNNSTGLSDRGFRNEMAPVTTRCVQGILVDRMMAGQIRMRFAELV
jgi:hypothetical protein